MVTLYLFVTLLISIPFGSLVGAHKTISRSRHRNVARQTNNTKTYILEDFYQAEDFFTNWTFFTGADPTGGLVNYLDMNDAISKGLAYVDDCDNSTVLAVDSTSSVSAGGNRNSVRITSSKTYTGGLFILDAAAMPVGCGTWPSFWTTGANWPYQGEIDIVEGVNDQSTNQMTLHSGTSNACTIGNNTSQFSGKVLGSNCYSTPTQDAGCGITDTNTTSFGYGFNNGEGGVFVLLWDASAGMSIWHFARANIPADITNRAPTPSNWGTPAGFWSAQTCDISANFFQHSMVIDTTVCGNWAGGAYASSSCPGTCSDIVANATNFVDARWEINYVAVYQPQ